MKSQIQRVTSSVVRLLLVVLLILVTLTFAIIQGGFFLWFVFFMLLPFVCFSALIFIAPIGNITIEREMNRDRLIQGQSIKMKIILKRNSSWPIPFLVVQEVEPSGVFRQLDEKVTRKLIPIGFKKEVSWTYVVEKLPRGKHELFGFQVGAADSLGWVRKSKFIESPKTFIVYPHVEQMQFNRTISHEQGQFGQTNRKKQHHSTMVASVREYAPGDRMSWIHWSSLAKTGDLYTKEFEFQQSEDVCVLLDGMKGYEFEGQVSLAASLLSAAHHQKEHVCFLGAGERRFELDQVHTLNDVENLMYYLATVSPTTKDITGKYDGDELLTSTKAIILITSNMTSKWVELLGRSAKKGSVPIIYVVTCPNYKIFNEEMAIKESAEKMGIRVQYTHMGHFHELSKGAN